MIIHFECDSSFSRPVIALDNVFPGCKALIDTGALFPVWTALEGGLVDLGAYPDPKKSTGTIGGFGGKAEGNLYRINLRMDQIFYLDLPIIATKLEMCRFHLILPATMFQDMQLSVNLKDRYIDIDTCSNQISYHMHHKSGDDGTLVLVNQ